MNGRPVVKENVSCLWCKKNIVTERRDKARGDRVCQPCSIHRQWLLDCIRGSDRPALYVQRVEEKERPKREELQAAIEAADRRAREQAASDKVPLVPIKPFLYELNPDRPLRPLVGPPPNHNGLEERLAKLESMLGKLVTELGGVAP